MGATPPPGSLVGNASLEVADRLADFLRSHPAATGRPDLIVVGVRAYMPTCLRAFAPAINCVHIWGGMGFGVEEVPISALLILFGYFFLLRAHSSTRLVVRLVNTYIYIYVSNRRFVE